MHDRTDPTLPLRFGRTAPGVAVADLQRALAFYTGVLGMKKTFENGDPVGFAIVERDAAEIHLHLVPGHRGSTLNVVHLLVDDVGALHARVLSAGVRVVKGPRDQDHGLRAFVMVDPDGNRIDVGQPL